MKKNILLVEDNRHKRERVLTFLSESWSSWVVTEAQSFTSGCRCVASDEYRLILMDMSLPTYDKSPKESGGRFRTLGGREVARKALRKGSQARVLFLTQYDAFGDGQTSHTLETLDIELSAEFKNLYLGLVYYNSSQSAWKEKISKVLEVLDSEDTNS